MMKKIKIEKITRR